MRTSLLPFALSVILLAGCNPGRSPAAAATGASAVSTTDGTTPPSLPEPAEAGDVPASSTADGSDAQARFDGYGDVKLGIAAADMQSSWGGALTRLGGDEETCYFLTPKWVGVPADFAFMIEDGTFVRYGTESSRFAAPGGGKVGMSMADIESLYPGRIEQQPHAYTSGKYLRIKDAATGNALLFETDASGKVTEWRVGMPPQLDYVEGCS